LLGANCAPAVRRSLYREQQPVESWVELTTNYHLSGSFRSLKPLSPNQPKSMRDVRESSPLSNQLDC
jgi:hypothetical protein